MKFDPSPLGVQLLALNLVCTAIVELFFRRYLKKFPAIDRSQYQNVLWSQLLVELRDKRILLVNSIRKFLHFSIICFVWLFLTSVIPSYIYFPAIAVLSTYFYYRWDFLELDMHLEFNRRSKECPDPIYVRKLQSLKNNSKNFATLVIILGSLWFYQAQTMYRDYRENFLEESKIFLDSQWCSTEYYDIDDYGDPYYAGWPCIRVEEIADISFESRNFKDVACVELFLEEEIGPYGQYSFREDWGSSKFCIEDSYGFSVEFLKWEIGESLSSRLQGLQNQLCRDLQYQYSVELFSRYCASATLKS